MLYLKKIVFIIEPTFLLLIFVIKLLYFVTSCLVFVKDLSSLFKC